MLFEFWALNTDGSLRCPLPDVETFTISPVVNDAGSVTFTYPVNGINWSVLNETVTADRDVQIQVRIDDVVQPELQCIMFDGQGDDVVEGSVWTYTGLLAAGRLVEGIVKPKGGMPSQGTDSALANDAHYYSCTAGTIVSTLLAEAVTRGALTDITHASFNGVHDSNGVNWTKIITLKFAPGTDYLKCLQGLVEAGMCEFKMSGKDLKLFEPPVGVDRTLTSPPLIFRVGASLLDSPRKHTVRDTGTSALVAGAEGVYTWADDADALTRRGRRIEVGVSQGQISDPGTLSAYAQTFLSGKATGRMEKTHGLSLAGGSSSDCPVPVADFKEGDWAWSDLGAGLERLRIAQWTVSREADGTLSGSVVMNDLMAEREAALARRLQGIEGGTTILGTSNARTIPDTLVDGIAPLPPTGTTVSSVAYVTSESVVLAAVTVQWDAVTFNSNSTAVTDLGFYTVYWRYSASDMSPVGSLISWQLAAQTKDVFCNFSAVRPGAAIQVRVGASDAIGNFSGWASTVNHTTATDTTAPATPSTPLLTALIAAIRIEWNGLGSLGEAIPKDFKFLEIHVSTVSGFTPSTSTLWDTIVSAAALGYTKVVYGTTYFVKFVGVDLSGNRSTASAQSSAAPRQILNPDYAALSIGSAQINDLDVGKITSGTLTAAVIISGSIATAASGARFGMNSSELFAFNASAVKTFQVTNAGAVSILGEIKTAASGARIVINPAGTAPTEMRFYPANATLGKYVTFVASDAPGWPGYCLTYLKGDRGSGLAGEAVLRLWWYEAAFGWFDSTAGLLVDTESSVYARQYSAGMNGSRLQFAAHGLRDSPIIEFVWTMDSATQSLGLGRFKQDADHAFIMGCPAKGSAICLQGNWIYAVAEGNTSLHVGFTASTVTQSSGSDVKTNVIDIEHDVLDVLDRAPAKRWEYTRDHEPRPLPDPIRSRRVNPKRGEPVEDVVPVELEPLRLPVQKHFGPMAEDLPDGVRVYTPQDPTQPHIDHGSLMGFMWEILRRMHKKVKKQNQDIDAIKIKLGM